MDEQLRDLNEGESERVTVVLSWGTGMYVDKVSWEFEKEKM
jgi:hypothetical protein